MKLIWHRQRPALIGVVHLIPLPGAPLWGGSMEAVVRRAVADAKAYAKGGADAVFIENFGDLPFSKGRVAPETIAAMAVAGQAVREAVRLPMGFNVLRNDAQAALALSAACGGQFVRVNVHTGVMVTDQGLIEGEAYETLRMRRRLGVEVEIWADVHVKHATPLGRPDLAQTAKDTLDRGLADALIVTGSGTGQTTAREDLEIVRSACPKARLLVGSGVNGVNAGDYRGLADGFIVGTSLKHGGRVERPVDPRRVEQLRRAL